MSLLNMGMTCGAVRSPYNEIVRRHSLPHKIVEYVDDEDVGQAAERQWKAMVEDMRINLENQRKGKGQKEEFEQLLGCS
ncbi:hypothetical protein TB1_004434 [Malus domestica]